MMSFCGQLKMIFILLNMLGYPEHDTLLNSRQGGKNVRGISCEFQQVSEA